MKINSPNKTIKKLIKRLLSKKSSRRKAISEDEIDHFGTELYDELGPIATEEEDLRYGLQEKGYHKPEPEDSM